MNHLNILLATLGLLFLLGCQEQIENNVSEDTTPQVFKTYTDHRGKNLKLPYPVTRAIGLAPSLTEVLFETLPDSVIVGRTQNCNFPEACSSLPEVNNYPIDFEKLLSLKPQVVFVQEGMTPEKDIRRMEELGLNVFYLKYNTISDLITSFGTIASMTSDSATGEKLVEQYFENIENIKEEPEKRPKVLALASTSPIYVYGYNSIFSEKIYIAGGINASGEEFSHPFPELNSEYILKINPDIVIGGSFGYMDSTFFTVYPELKAINAYQNRCVYKANEDLMSRPSPRIIASIKELKKILKQCN